MRTRPSAALQAAYNALRPGGWLVFADRVFDERWTAHAKGGAAPFWDVGHPCSPKAYLIDHFLAQLSDSPFNFVVMLGFANTAFAAAKKSFAKDLYVGRDVADEIREIALETIRRVRAIKAAYD